jgi:hypothetical protein
MSFVKNPFGLEPLKPSILQVSQIQKETHSLELHIAQIRDNIAKAPIAKERVETQPALQPELPSRFLQPGMNF